MPLTPGSNLGNYEIAQPLGAGGMAEVYRAKDRRLGREVAIKVIPTRFATDRERLRRFMAEARTVSSLNHPNILTLHEIGESESGPYIVTELVEGSTVRQLLADGPLGVEQTLDIAIQVADGLAKAHDAGVVHRDIKPENLMLTRDRFVKILDFGLAKFDPDAGPPGMASDQNLTATGVVVGTPAYLSPEQLQGEPVDGRTDLFALGAVIHEMLTGAHPFRRDSAAGTLAAILTEPPPPVRSKCPGCPPELAEILRKAMSKSPGARFASASEMAAALRRVRASGTAVTGRTSAPAGGAPWGRLAAGLAILVAGAFALHLSRTVRESGAPADIGSDAPEHHLRRVAESSMMDPSPPEGKMGIVVLSILDETADAELEKARIGRILTDAFVQAMTDVEGLYVISPQRLASLAGARGYTFEEASRDFALSRSLAEEAHAQAILSGTLSRLGGTFVLSATISQIPSDTVLDTFRATAETPQALLAAVTEVVGTRIRDRYSETRETPREAPPPVKALATHSIDAYAHYLRGDDLVQEGRWSEAIDELQDAVKLDPEMALAWSSLSCAFSFAGDDIRARAAFLKATDFLDRLNERERRWVELDGIWVNTGNADIYRKGILEYIRDFPDDRDSYFYAGLGEEYLEGDLAAALEWYEKAFQMVPNYYPVTKALVECCMKLGRKEQAIDALRRYLAVPFIGSYGRDQAQTRLQGLTGEK